MRVILNTKSGFSLIEVLVYLAVTLLIAGAAVMTYISLSTTLARNATERAVNHGAQAALERLGRDIKHAESINLAQSTFGTSPGEITLVHGTTTTNVVLDGTALMLTVNGVPLGPLTPDSVSVDSFIVSRYTGTGTSTELVRVELIVSAENKSATTTRRYHTSGVLRGSYE